MKYVSQNLKTMKTIFLLLLMSVSIGAFSQTYKSVAYVERESKFTSVDYETSVTILPTTITIKKWNNDKSSDQIMKVDKIENKPYFDRVCTWYFCTDAKKDISEDYFRKSICIYDKSTNTLIYANFADEVTIFWYKFYLK